MLTIPDLNRLKVFYIVYKSKSLLEAAQSLHVTRSAVSQNLKALETELATTLFVRDSKKILPTAVADSLFQLMDPFILELEATLGHIETGQKEPVGHLRVGAPLDYGTFELTQQIAKFRSQYPSVTFEIFFGVPVKQLDLLVNGKIDLAIVDNGNLFVKNYPIAIETIQKEEFVLTTSQAFYAKYVDSDHSIANLQSLPVVDYLPHGPVARMWYKHQFNKTISKLNVVYSAENVRAVIQAITSNIGIGVVPSHLAKQNRLKIIAGDKRPLVNQISLALPLAKKLSFTEKTFISFFKEQISR